MATKSVASKLAIHGGPKAVTLDPGDLFTWPIVTQEDEQAVLDVLRRGAMSGNDVTKVLEQEIAAYFGTKYGLGYCNGTAALLGGMWACGLGVGTELIGPSLAYWAAVMPALGLGATLVFADVLPDTLCIDPADVERKITPRTKAILALHNYGYPCDMDRIMAIAKRHQLMVIEDVSHAQGGLYQGRKLGGIGDIGCMSLMSGKSLAMGEAGVIVTNNRRLWERAIAFGFYERTGQSRYANAPSEITEPDLVRFAGLPLGGFKHRMHQLSSAMGRVQLKHYPQRMGEIDQAMNYFCDGLEGVPGLRPHRVPKGSGSTMAGWYVPVAHYRPEELGGLSVDNFCEAVTAEGFATAPGVNFPLHLHPLFHEADIYGQGKPTVLAHADRDVRMGKGSLPVSEAVRDHTLGAPYFKRFRPRLIDQYLAAFRKVAENAPELLSQ